MNESPRPLIFGEVLFDRFPDGKRVLGGAPFNVAWNLRGLGFDPLLVSAVGDDAMGREVIDAMRSWGLDLAGIQIVAEAGTGIVDVTIEDGEPTFDIVVDRAWDRICAEALPRLPPIALAYHGTLALRQEASRPLLEELLRRARAPIFLDVNLRSPWWDPALVRSRIAAADVIKMNETELLTLFPGTPESASSEIMNRYRPEMLCVTRGAEGAVAYTPTRSSRLGPPAARTEVCDTVGAGDAFAAVLVAGRLEGWALEQTLSRAQSLAVEVVGLRGATVADPHFYGRFKSEWRLP